MSCHPSFCLSFHLSGHFWIVSLTFSKFWHGVRNPYEVGHGSWIFQEKFFCPQNLENGPKMGQKQFFFNLLGNLFLDFYWIWPIMKIYIIFYLLLFILLCTNSIFRKMFVLEIWTKMLYLQKNYINHISRRNKWNDLIFWILIKICTS